MFQLCGRRIFERWGNFLRELQLGVLSSFSGKVFLLKLRLRDLWYCHGNDCDLHFFVRGRRIFERWGKYLRELQHGLLFFDNRFGIVRNVPPRSVLGVVRRDELHGLPGRIICS